MAGLTSSPLLRNILAVAGGAAAGQAVMFAFSPLITRIYTPEAFGLQGVFLSLISVLSPAIALRYPMAVVVAEDEAEASAVARLALLVAFGLSCSIGAALLVTRDLVLALLGAEELGALIWLLPLALFCVALQDVADYRAARAGQFRLVGIATVGQAFISNMARVLGGLVTPVAGILIAVTSVAPAVQSTMLRVGLHRTRVRPAALTWAGTRSLICRYYDFPLYRMPTDVLNSASQAAPVILLAALFSPAAAGLYVLTRSVMNLPVNLIGAAVGNVLYARFAELSRAGRPLRPLLKRATTGLMALTPIIIGLSLFAPSVFAVIFGEEWREAGHYAQWMSLWIGMMLVNTPMTRIVPIIRRQKLLLIYNVALLAIRVLSVTVAAWLSDSALVAVASFSVSSTVMIIVGNFTFFRCVTKFDAAQKETSYV